MTVDLDSRSTSSTCGENVLAARMDRLEARLDAELIKLWEGNEKASVSQAALLEARCQVVERAHRAQAVLLETAILELKRKCIPMETVQGMCQDSVHRAMQHAELIEGKCLNAIGVGLQELKYKLAEVQVHLTAFCDAQPPQAAVPHRSDFTPFRSELESIRLEEAGQLLEEHLATINEASHASLPEYCQEDNSPPGESTIDNPMLPLPDIDIRQLRKRSDEEKVPDAPMPNEKVLESVSPQFGSSFVGDAQEDSAMCPSPPCLEHAPHNRTWDVLPPRSVRSESDEDALNVTRLRIASLSDVSKPRSESDDDSLIVTRIRVGSLPEHVPPGALEAAKRYLSCRTPLTPRSSATAPPCVDRTGPRPIRLSGGSSVTLPPNLERADARLARPSSSEHGGSIGFVNVRSHRPAQGVTPPSTPNVVRSSSQTRTPRVSGAAVVLSAESPQTRAPRVSGAAAVVLSAETQRHTGVRRFYSNGMQSPPLQGRVIGSNAPALGFQFVQRPG